MLSRVEYSKFGMSVGSMYPQTNPDKDSELFDVNAVHADPPKGVSKEVL